jgi:hypothetical protein
MLHLSNINMVYKQTELRVKYSNPISLQYTYV